ncbi:MAG TPA: phosphonoacetaldehyde hydrolase [Bryobacteraceae bacterium]|jgi:phosphonoacetaldehyde hydrolase|nr:phosphonoacetaldehyde hydrolase [Bryobacteraceae bacterium]
MKFDFLKAVILDWAGTAVDYGSLAPVAALQRVFAANGIEITAAEARKDMGVLKKDQIRFIFSGDRVSSEWTRLHGRAPSEDDVVRLFIEFLPRQAEILTQFSNPIDGVPETVEEWKAAGLRIGSTTGYTRELLNIVAAAAASQGYAPETSVTPDEAGAGRPAPFMCYRNAITLGVYPLSAFVKIGDTPSDIAEGRNAGMWTIAITRTGNEIGLSKSQWDALPIAEQESLEQQAGARLCAAGAQYVAGSLADCKPFLIDIDRRLGAGERP